MSVRVESAVGVCFRSEASRQSYKRRDPTGNSNQTGFTYKYVLVDYKYAKLDFGGRWFAGSKKNKSNVL